MLIDIIDHSGDCPGGGAIEAALSIFLENFATTLDSREQLAIAEFANALLIIPKTLAVNAAKDATELIAKLRAYHYTAQSKPEKKHLSNFGLDLEHGSIRDNVAAGVLEPVLAKTKIIQVICCVFQSKTCGLPLSPATKASPMSSS